MVDEDERLSRLTSVLAITAMLGNGVAIRHRVVRTSSFLQLTTLPQRGDYEQKRFARHAISYYSTGRLATSITKIMTKQQRFAEGVGGFRNVMRL